MSKRDRDQTFWKVLNAALDLDFRKGHLKWTMSELSRKSGITRSLIYYHFGRSKTAILQEAVRVIGEQLIGTDPERMQQWRSGDWTKGSRSIQGAHRRSPSLLNFYFLHRSRPTEIGESLRKLEADYYKKLNILFPDLDHTAHQALFAFFWGVTFAPDVERSAIGVAVNALKTLTRKKSLG